MDVPSLASLLHETAEHHGPDEKSHAAHNSWDWYAAYVDARQHGRTQDAASEAAGHYMEEVLHVACAMTPAESDSLSDDGRT